LLAATNRPEVLDQALLRPGRISRRIVVPLPDVDGRQAILRVHLRNVPMESDEFKEQATQHLAAITPGFSGAELFNVVNEGALLTARRNGDVVQLTDLVMGVQRTRDGVNGRPPVLSAAAAKLAGMLGRGKAEPARASPMF
jgi:ATP-dependent Zn protease